MPLTVFFLRRVNVPLMITSDFFPSSFFSFLLPLPVPISRERIFYNSRASLFENLSDPATDKPSKINARIIHKILVRYRVARGEKEE